MYTARFRRAGSSATADSIVVPLLILSQNPIIDCAAVGQLLHTLPDGEPVWGVTSLDNLLYVLRDGKSTEQIEVYNKDSYCLQRCITVPGLGVGTNMISLLITVVLMLLILRTGACTK